MEEPLKDVFFQPANHPYFVKDKSFWTIDRLAQKHKNDSATFDSCIVYRCESSRAASVNPLESALTLSSHLSLSRDVANDDTTCSTPGTRSVQELSTEPVINGVPDVDSQTQQDKRPGVEAMAAAQARYLASLTRSASFLTDSISRKKHRRGYFDTEWERDGSISASVDKPCGMLRHSLGNGYHNSSYEGSETPPRLYAADSGSLQAADIQEAFETMGSSVADSRSICSIGSCSSGGGDSGERDIQPMSITLDLAEEVREDVARLSTSLTRRLFFARQRQDEMSTAALYHRDSDRSHLTVMAAPLGCGTMFSVRQGHARSYECDQVTARASSRVSGHSGGNRQRQESSFFDVLVPELEGSGVSGRALSHRDLSSHHSDACAIRAGASQSFEQFEMDDGTGETEGRSRKWRRRRRHCCRTALLAAVLSSVALTAAVVGALFALGELSVAEHLPSVLTTTLVPSTVMYPNSLATEATAQTSVAPTNFTITFVGALRLMMDFTPELADMNSSAAKNLSNMFCTAVDRIYTNTTDGLTYNAENGCQVTNFTHGSIKMNFRVIFTKLSSGTSRNDSSAEEAVITKLRVQVQKNDFGGLQWDTEFFEMHQELSTPLQVTFGPTTAAKNKSDWMPTREPTKHLVSQATSSHSTASVTVTAPESAQSNPSGSNFELEATASSMTTASSWTNETTLVGVTAPEMLPSTWQVPRCGAGAGCSASTVEWGGASQNPDLELQSSAVAWQTPFAHSQPPALQSTARTTERSLPNEASTVYIQSASTELTEVEGRDSVHASSSWTSFDVSQVTESQESGGVSATRGSPTEQHVTEPAAPRTSYELSSSAAPTSREGSTTRPPPSGDGGESYSPCRGNGTSSMRLIADPVNCRAFYVCLNNSHVLVHMSCPLPFMYYDSAAKSCKPCVVAKCSQCFVATARADGASPLLQTSGSLYLSSASAFSTKAFSLHDKIVASGGVTESSGQVSATLISITAVNVPSTSLPVCQQPVPPSNSSKQPLCTPVPAGVLHQHAEAGPLHVLTTSTAAGLTSTDAGIIGSSGQESLTVSLAVEMSEATTQAALHSITPISVGGSDEATSEITAAYSISAFKMAAKLLPLHTTFPSLPPGSSKLASETSENPLAHHVGGMPFYETAHAAAGITAESVHGTRTTEYTLSDSSSLPASSTSSSAVQFARLLELVTALYNQPLDTTVVQAEGTVSSFTETPSTHLSPASAPTLAAYSRETHVPATQAAEPSHLTLFTTAQTLVGHEQVDRSTGNPISKRDACRQHPEMAGTLVANPDDCTGFVYCFQGSAMAIRWQCRCDEMYNATLSACQPCDRTVCGACRPCADLASSSTFTSPPP